MAKYFAIFDQNGNRVTGYFADGMPYSEEEIRLIFPTAIELSEEEQRLYLNPGPEAPWGYHRDAETGSPVVNAAPEMPIETARRLKNDQIDRYAAVAYTKGFYSEASGAVMWYDSDEDTQKLIAGIYQQTKESDWATLVRYEGVAEAGFAPMRARPRASDSSAAKTVLLLSAEQIKTLVDDLSAALFTIKKNVWEKKALVAAATTSAEVLAVDPTV